MLRRVSFALSAFSSVRRRMRASSCQSVSTAVSVGDLATFGGNRGAPRSASSWAEKDLNMGSRSDTDSSVDLCDVDLCDVLWRTMVPH